MEPNDKKTKLPKLDMTLPRASTSPGIVPTAADERFEASSSALPSTPVTIDGSGRTSSLRSLGSRIRRSFSSRNTTPADSSSSLENVRTVSRRLSKAPPASPGFEVLNRPGPGFSISKDHRTVASTIYWQAQTVEGTVSLKAESHPALQYIKKPPYLVVTSEYVVKLKNHSDVLALFPQLSGGDHWTGSTSNPDPVWAIPITSIVAIYRGEDALPAFSFEIWWKSPEHFAYNHTTVCFNLPAERDAHMETIQKLVFRTQTQAEESVHPPASLLAHIQEIRAAVEGDYHQSEPVIFPMVPRGRTRKQFALADEEEPKNVHETPCFYLAVGAHFVILLSAKLGKSGQMAYQDETYGLLTLDQVSGTWNAHEERFILGFCEPFRKPVALELGSRFWREIIRVLSKADRFLKPAWPLQWQENELFNDVVGFNKPSFAVSRDDFGGLKRTLDAFLSAYRCDEVEWEINWRTRFSPEFRLVPPKDGHLYSRHQILAVLRALRFNDFFRSLSFRDVDLQDLWDCNDNWSKAGAVAYFNRLSMTLEDFQWDMLSQASILEREIHALAFCSGAVRQMDFTNCLANLPLPKKDDGYSFTIQVLKPILTLLKSGGTKCNYLILAGNPLKGGDRYPLSKALEKGLVHGLDVSRCCLSDKALRELFESIIRGGKSIQTLNLGNNLGNIESSWMANLISAYRPFKNVRELNLCGVLLDTSQGKPLISCDILRELTALRELDLSRFEIDEMTLAHLEKFLIQRGCDIDDDQPSEFHRLVLVKCGVTGSQAARLFSAIGEDHGIHLFLSGNPMELGVEDLALSIRKSRGPAGLNMEMVEFKNETNFALLMNALAETKHMSLLSLVGTAPTPTSERKCSPATVDALENFFSHNASVKYLDFSGVRGRLEEGVMGQGFGRSLLGLRKNTSLEFLRIRNQDLHDDVGVLGTVLQENKSIRTFDCQGNGLNMTGFIYLVNSLQANHTITHFPVGTDERRKIWDTTMAGLRGRIRHKSPAIAAAAAAATAVSREMSMMQQEREPELRRIFEEKLDLLEAYLVRNREALQEASSQELVFDQGGSAGNASPHLSIEEKHAWSPVPSPDGHGDVGVGPESEEPSGEVREDGEHHDNSNETLKVPRLLVGEDNEENLERASLSSRRPRLATVRSSNVSVNTSARSPYRVKADEELESPGTPGVASSEASTPLDLSSPPTPDEAGFREEVVSRLKELGADP